MSEPMTTKRLTEIAARAEAVTKGQWDFPLGVNADAEFIGHARADVWALLAEVERLRVELEQWRAHHLRLTEANLTLNDRLDDAFEARVKAENEARKKSHEIERFRAELAGRPTRAEVLRETANNWTAHCPDHSNDTDEVWMECPCYWTDELRRTANVAEAGESK